MHVFFIVTLCLVLKNVLSVSNRLYAAKLGSIEPPQLVLPKATAHDLYTGRDPGRVKIFDTTLRDGEQSPGCTLTEDEKMVVAKQLAKLGVDIIEAGFPIASPGDFQAVKRIADTIGQNDDPPIICGLSRALKKDIDVCYDAIKGAKFPRIHTFIATSDIHMEHKLCKSRDQVLDMTTEMVGHAKSHCDDVEFSGEDALRSDPEFLYEVYSRAIEAGATTINVPDTVGYTTPGEFKALIQALRAEVRGIHDVTISVHGHNDLGLAVANFLAAVEGGARQLECTINGIGERAGNAALEELVMALHVRKAYFNSYFGHADDDETELTNVKTREIYKTSKLVSSLTGMMVQANKAIVGANAFAHESGIHQDGVLKNKRTYEIMDSDSIGISDDNNIVLGKHSGRAAFRSRLDTLGYKLEDADLNRAFGRFKEIADKKKTISNMDLECIINDEITDTRAERYQLAHVQVLAGDFAVPTATVKVRDERLGAELVASSIGTGPVDAAFKAVQSLCENGEDAVLQEYTVSSVTAGIDALGEVTVRLRSNESGRTVFGRSANTDVIVASTQAYIMGLNRLADLAGKEMPTHPQFSTAL